MLLSTEKSPHAPLAFLNTVTTALVVIGVALGTRKNLGQALVLPFPWLFWPWHLFFCSKLAHGYANPGKLCLSCFTTCLPFRENVTCIYVSVSRGQHHSLNLPGACAVSYPMKKLRYFFILGGIVLHPCQNTVIWKRSSRALWIPMWIWLQNKSGLEEASAMQQAMGKAMCTSQPPILLFSSNPGY